MKKIEHIGIAVKDIEQSNKIFSKIFGIKSYKSEIIDSEGVITSFFRFGSHKIELVAPINKKGPIQKYLDNNRQGIHHIAFDVEDIQKEMKRISAHGIRLLNDKPKIGADNKLICFLHPKDTNGVLIELCQEIKK